MNNASGAHRCRYQRRRSRGLLSTGPGLLFLLFLLVAPLAGAARADALPASGCRPGHGGRTGRYRRGNRRALVHAEAAAGSGGLPAGRCLALPANQQCSDTRDVRAGVRLRCGPATRRNTVQRRIGQLPDSWRPWNGTVQLQRGASSGSSSSGAAGSSSGTSGSMGGASRHAERWIEHERSNGCALVHAENAAGSSGGLAGGRWPRSASRSPVQRRRGTFGLVFACVVAQPTGRDPVPARRWPTAR